MEVMVGVQFSHAARFGQRREPGDERLLERHEIVAVPGILEARERLVAGLRANGLAERLVAVRRPVGPARKIDVSVGGGIEARKFAQRQPRKRRRGGAHREKTLLLVEERIVRIDENDGHRGIRLVIDRLHQIRTLDNDALRLPVLDKFLRRPVGAVIFHLDDAPAAQLGLCMNAGQLHLMGAGVNIGKKENRFHGVRRG